jgi:hypothetical protein
LLPKLIHGRELWLLGKYLFVLEFGLQHRRIFNTVINR